MKWGKNGINESQKHALRTFNLDLCPDKFLRGKFQVLASFRGNSSILATPHEDTKSHNGGKNSYSRI